MLRFFLATVAMTAASAAWAQTGPSVRQGAFAFQGRYQISGQRHYELVRTADEAGRTRMRELQGQGYDCSPGVGPEVLCGKRVPVTDRPELAVRILDRCQGYVVRFGPVSGVSSESDSPVYKSWRVQQVVQVHATSGVQTYDHAFYTWTQAAERVTPGDSRPAGDSYLAASSGGLTLTYDVSFQNGRFSRDTYYVEAALEPMSSSLK